MYYTLFLLINSLLISLLSIFVGILFCKVKGPGPCHWSLVCCGCCSVTQLYVTLCEPMDSSTLGFCVLHYLPVLAQIHVHWLSYTNHLILCHSLLPLPSIFPSTRIFTSGLFTSSGQRIGASASASVLPMTIQGWFPLEWTGWISLQSKGLSRVFSSTTVQNHQFFGVQPSLRSNFHIHIWLLEKP